jgi:lipopolysaccharide biosynthesis glycosyltransferase
MRKIFFACDDNYLYPLIFTVFSMCTTSEQEKNSIVLVVDREKFSENSQRVFKEICKLLNVSAEIKFYENSITQTWIGHVSPAAFLKCFILTFDQLPDNFLISDVDVLYKRGWTSIWDSNVSLIEQPYISVSRDRIEIDLASTNPAIRHAKDFYFNSGVILVNNLFKPEGFNEEALSKVISNYNGFGFDWHDQCVLNYLLSGSKAELSPEFNKFVAYPKKTNDGSILHFIGGIKKPWTIPLNPINRFLILNSKLFPGAYWDYYIKEIQFFAEILRRNARLGKDVFTIRKKCVDNAPKWTYYFKARVQKYLRMREIS